MGKSKRNKRIRELARNINPAHVKSIARKLRRGWSHSELAHVSKKRAKPRIPETRNK